MLSKKCRTELVIKARLRESPAGFVDSLKRAKKSKNVPECGKKFKL